MRCAILLSVLGLSFGLSVAPPSFKDLIRSLSTKEAIWLYVQSYPAMIHQKQVLCVRYIKKSLTRSTYNFIRYYRLRGYDHKDRLYGILAPPASRGVGPTLTTYKDPKLGNGKRYTLMYWNDGEFCSVFQVKQYVFGYP
ncbi:uncharacterized protein LOC144151759 [Haemaphysalis longicornis]